MIVDPAMVHVVTELIDRIVEEAGEGINEGILPLPLFPPLGGDNGPREDKEAGEANEVPLVLEALCQGMARKEKNAMGFERV